MKIGELACQAGCPVETVRYYEREQLLPAALRDQNNNYRHYDKRHLEQLVFIRRCRSLEMTHDEIRELLAARQEPDAGCSAIDGLIEAHLEHVRTRMAELKALEAELNDLRGRRPRRTAHAAGHQGNFACGNLLFFSIRGHTMTDKKPEETTIDEGLAKLHEASEQLTEQQIDALAQAAKEAAQESRREAQPAPAAKTKPD